MAIINTVFDESKIPVNAVNVKEATQYWKRYFTDPSTRIWTYETYVGLCLEEYERNGYGDSDFYMIIWNDTFNAPEHYCFASTRGWTYPSYGSRPDATPRVLQAYKDWKDREAEAARWAAEFEEAKTPRCGKEVKVVRGRKVPVGTTGRIFWTGSMLYGVAIGVQTKTGEKFFTSIKNIEVV
jgi:hypothetical protein